jgi:hypothetical protein
MQLDRNLFGSPGHQQRYKSFITINSSFIFLRDPGVRLRSCSNNASNFEYLSLFLEQATLFRAPFSIDFFSLMVDTHCFVE